MNNPERKERRKFPRKEIKIELKCLEGGSFSTRFTRDIGAGGLFAEANKPFPLGSEVFLDFFLPGIRDKFKLKGQVIHRVTKEQAKKDGYVPGTGIEFIEISQPIQDILNKFVKTKQERGSLRLLLDLHLQEEQFLVKLRQVLGGRKKG